MKHAALFDLDGTLLNSIGDLRTAINETRASYGQEPLPEASVRAFVGDGVRLLVERGLSGVPHDPDEAVRRQLENYRRHWLDTTCLYPGVADGLRLLRGKGWKLGIVTNKPGPAAQQILNHLKIGDFWDGLVCGDEKFPFKPDPAGCLALLEQFGAEPSASAMVGDHYTDLEAGRRAGMRRVLVRWGFGNPRTETWDCEVQDFASLTAWLLNEENWLR